jgi:hypothetical protein
MNNYRFYVDAVTKLITVPGVHFGKVFLLWEQGPYQIWRVTGSTYTSGVGTKSYSPTEHKLMWVASGHEDCEHWGKKVQMRVARELDSVEAGRQWKPAVEGLKQHALTKKPVPGDPPSVMTQKRLAYEAKGRETKALNDEWDQLCRVAKQVRDNPKQNRDRIECAQKVYALLIG